MRGAIIMRAKSMVIALSIVLAVSSSISIASAASGVNNGDCGKPGSKLSQGLKPNSKAPGAPKNPINSTGSHIPTKDTKSNTPTTVNTSADSSVVIDGGFATDGQDHGRPVILIAAALGVPY
jgi:hypothetical protein